MSYAERITYIDALEMISILGAKCAKKLEIISETKVEVYAAGYVG